MSSQASDLKFLTDLLAQPERAPRTKVKADTRDHDTWFKLPSIVMGTCSNDECVSVLLEQKQGRNRVTAVVNDFEMCRFCFLDGWKYKAPE